MQSIAILPFLRYSTEVAITPNTRKEDDRLREELKHADLEKFKKVLKSVVLPEKTNQEAGRKLKQKTSHE